MQKSYKPHDRFIDYVVATAAIKKEIDEINCDYHPKGFFKGLLSVFRKTKFKDERAKAKALQLKAAVLMEKIFNFLDNEPQECEAYSHIVPLFKVYLYQMYAVIIKLVDLTDACYQIEKSYTTKPEGAKMNWQRFSKIWDEYKTELQELYKHGDELTARCSLF